MVMLFVYILSVVLAAVAGFRLGRSGDTDKSTGASGGAAGRAVADSLATTEDINRAVDDSISSNAEARDIIEKIQDIVRRHSNDGSNTGGGSSI